MDIVETIYSVGSESNSVAKVLEMTKEGHWVRLEGDNLAWILGTKWTKLVTRADKVKN